MELLEKKDPSVFPRPTIEKGKGPWLQGQFTLSPSFHDFEKGNRPVVQKKEKTRQEKKTYVIFDKECCDSDPSLSSLKEEFGDNESQKSSDLQSGDELHDNEVYDNLRRCFEESGSEKIDSGVVGKEIVFVDERREVVERRRIPKCTPKICDTEQFSGSRRFWNFKRVSDYSLGK